MQKEPKNDQLYIIDWDNPEPEPDSDAESYDEAEHEVDGTGYEEVEEVDESPANSNPSAYNYSYARYEATPIINSPGHVTEGRGISEIARSFATKLLLAILAIVGVTYAINPDIDLKQVWSDWQPRIEQALTSSDDARTSPEASNQKSDASTMSNDLFFKDMLRQSLSTNSVTITKTRGNTRPIISRVDLSNPKYARLYSTVTYPAKVEYYTTPYSYYLKGVGVRGRKDGNFTNSWVAHRTHGEKPSRATLNDDAKVESVLYSQVPLGNYSAEQQEEALGFITKEAPYRFDLKEVRPETIDGIATRSYKIKLNSNAAVSVGRFMAKLNGHEQPRWQFSTPDLAKQIIYNIRTDDNRLHRITEVYGDWNSLDEARRNNAVRTITFSDYNSTTLPAEPTDFVIYAD